MALLEVKNVKRIYTTRFGAVKVQALNDVNFSVEEGEYVAIMGESGSGKTTLLNILASLDKATSGQVLLNGRDLSQIRQKQRAAVCRALITRPEIVLADEPTGALDSRVSGKLLRLFADINREGQTILMVTPAQHSGGLSCRPCAVYQGRHRISSDLQGKSDGRRHV